MRLRGLVLLLVLLAFARQSYAILLVEGMPPSGTIGVVTTMAGEWDGRSWGAGAAGAARTARAARAGGPASGGYGLCRHGGGHGGVYGAGALPAGVQHHHASL